MERTGLGWEKMKISFPVVGRLGLAPGSVFPAPEFIHHHLGPFFGEKDGDFPADSSSPPVTTATLPSSITGRPSPWFRMKDRASGR